MHHRTAGLAGMPGPEAGAPRKPTMNQLEVCDKWVWPMMPEPRAPNSA
jgi:hypothetical protein